MPTFFSRRYMRGRPGRLEQAIGAALLLLVGAVAALFVLTGGLLGAGVTHAGFVRRLTAGLGMPSEPLFSVDAEQLRRNTAPHALRLAAEVLPEPQGAGRRAWLTAWPVREGRTAALAAEACLEAGIAASFAPDVAICRMLEHFGAHWAFAAAYATPDSEEMTVALVVDGGEPQNAFGLAGALRPADAADVRLGRGGWLASDRRGCGFWSGRHFTLVQGAGAEAIARLLAGVQLAYGGPFPGERLLPVEEQVTGSLRYVRRAALGIDELRDCWLADYEGGRLLAVMTPQDPKTRAAELQARIDRVGRIDGRAAAVAHAGGAVFLALAGDDETARALARRAATRAGPTLPDSASMPEPVAGSAAAAVAGEARFPQIEGGDIAAPVRIERYADNLYEKIDGKEGMFRAFDVVDLRFGQYFDRRGNRSFDVYIYDMGEPANALGIYMTERSGEAEPLALGRSGYVSGTSVYFWKGRYYVNVLGPGEGGDEALAISRSIAAAVAGTIADDGRPLWAEEVLPPEDRVPHTFRYQARSALGYEFLNRAFLADYLADGRRFQAFISRCGSPREAAEVFDRLADAVKRYDTLRDRRGDEAGGERLIGESLGVFMAAFRKGPYVGGIVECEDRALAEERAAALAARLGADDAGDERGEAAPQDSRTPDVPRGGDSFGQEDDGGGY